MTTEMQPGIKLKYKRQKSHEVKLQWGDKMSKKQWAFSQRITEVMQVLRAEWLFAKGRVRGRQARQNHMETEGRSIEAHGKVDVVIKVMIRSSGWSGEQTPHHTAERLPHSPAAATALMWPCNQGIWSNNISLSATELKGSCAVLSHTRTDLKKEETAQQF